MIIGVDKHSILLYNNSTKKKKKPEGRPETETKGSRRRDCENEWFADVGLNGGTVKKVKVLESYLRTKGIIQ